MITKVSTPIPANKKEGRMFNSILKPLINSLPSAQNQFMRDEISDVKILDEQVKTTALYGSGIFIKIDSVYKKIMIEDIYLVEAMSDYMIICTKGKRYTIHSTLGSILEKLPQPEFMRVHKSYIVRMDSISAIDGNLLIVEDKKIPIGKTHYDELMSKLNFLG